MGKTRKNGKRPADANQWAHKTVELSTEGSTPKLPTKEQVSALMSELGRRGGRIGGKRRMQTMSPSERQEAARKAARARWRKEENE